MENLLRKGKWLIAQPKISILCQDFANIITRWRDFTIRGKWSKFEYGIKYLYVNDGFDKEPVTGLGSDKEGMEIWLNRSFGVFSIKTFYKDHWNNVDFVPKRERRKITEGGAALDLTIPSLPIIA